MFQNRTNAIATLTSPQTKAMASVLHSVKAQQHTTKMYKTWLGFGVNLQFSFQITFGHVGQDVLRKPSHVSYTNVVANATGQ